MADNFLGGLLGYGNKLRSNLRGLLGDPVTYTNEALGNALPSMEELAAQARLMGQTGEVPANVDPRIMDLGMGLLGAIKVYHGSPHAFTKADSSKIGTGEGAQAYGHGLYWAESPETAKTYVQEPSKTSADRWLVNGRKAKATIKDSAAIMVAERGKDDAIADLEWLLDRSRTYGPTGIDKYRDNLQKQIDLIKSGKIAPAVENKGNLYEASLRWPDPAREAADPLGPQHFLDWDKPLSEQPEAVRKAVAKFLPKAQKTTDPKWGDLGGPFYPEQEFTGQQVVSMLRSGSGTVDNIIGGGGRAVSDQLRKAGISGITYLDAGSRAAGQGTRNYVTFDDALIELLKRNGISLAGQ